MTFQLSEAAEAEIRERAATLEDYYARLNGCAVTVRAPAIEHHRKGGPFVVEIVMSVPGQALPVVHQTEQELSQAIREAFHAARRRLEDYAREQRGSVKTHEPATLGRVVHLGPELGDGFLETPDGCEIYFHHKSVDLAFDDLEIGSPVRFAEEEGEQGPQASTVILIKP